MEKTNPIEETKRYVANARKILSDHGELDDEKQSYNDRKYVRMAGNTLWNGMLILLEAVFKVGEQKGKDHRPDIIDYRKAIGQRNRKLLDIVNDAYSIMHLYMGYDGNKSKKICDGAFDYASKIIALCSPMLKNT